MAVKKRTLQPAAPMLFDVEAKAVVRQVSAKEKTVANPSRDIYGLGLNAIHDGTSIKFKKLSDSFGNKI